MKDVLTGDQQQHNVPATTTLAPIEQGLKTFTAIYKRVHLALKQELQKLYRLNRVYMNDQAHYKVGSEWRTITRQDYEAGSGVEPVSDPTMVSDMQKLGRAQFLMGFAMDPYCDGMEISTQPEDFRHRGLGGLQGEQRRHHIAHVRACLRGRQAPPQGTRGQRAHRHPCGCRGRPGRRRRIDHRKHHQTRLHDRPERDPAEGGWQCAFETGQ